MTADARPPEDTLRDALLAANADVYGDDGNQDAFAALNVLVAQRDALVAAIKAVAKVQPDVLEMLRRHEIVFVDLGTDPQNWEHIAFSIYTRLCDVDSLATEALAAVRVEGGVR